jgi:hypothetical protein
MPQADLAGTGIADWHLVPLQDFGTAGAVDADCVVGTSSGHVSSSAKMGGNGAVEGGAVELGGERDYR